jgi:hypothetical protein
MAGSRFTPEQVPLSVAISAGLAECFHCFPYNVPPDAKPCKVLVEGTWIDGFLLRWLRLPDGRRQGVVNYWWEESDASRSWMHPSSSQPRDADRTGFTETGTRFSETGQD